MAAALGPLLARGRTAEIYAWGPSHVVKLFLPGRAADAIEYEARVNRLAYAAGLPVPAVGELIEIDGRRGLIYERVDGGTMLERAQARPWLVDALARQLARLQRSVHSHDAAQLIPLRERLRKAISTGVMPDSLRTRALERLATLPDGDRLCHGDFHPDNVVLTREGPVIIDWLDATRGVSAADVARSSILLRLGSLPPGSAPPAARSDAPAVPQHLPA